tara:strand:+ start:2737 stop:4818 length:2082 start_codon:yes stop_codon:yes gene_type:complete
MKYNFEKVTDYNLIAPALSTINLEENNIISTSKLINNLRTSSNIPETEKQILKNRSDDKFSQKIRNLISHKVLEKYNLAKSSKNKIELTNHGKRLGKLINKNISVQNIIDIELLTRNSEYKKNLLMAKLNINFNPFLLEKLESCDLSVRAKKFIDAAGIKFVGDLVSNISHKEVMKFPNSGKITLNEIEVFLSQNNLYLGMKTNWNNIENKDYLAKEYSKNQTLNIDFNIDNIISKYLKKKSKETESQFERRKKIITLRFGLNGKFSTLDTIGKEFNITRERIRQIQSKFCNEIKNKADLKFSIKKLILFTSQQTPVLEKFLNVSFTQSGFFNTYKSFTNLRNIIASFTKYSFDIYVFRDLSYNLEEPSETTSFQEFLISSKKEEKNLNSIITNSRKWTTKFSYCNFNKLINSLFKTNNYSKFNNYKTSLALHENFLWFDEDNFIALDTAGQTVLSRLKKILFINKKISFIDFKEALLNDQRIDSVPPIDLLKKICIANKLKYDENFIYYSGYDVEIANLDKKIIKLFKENGEFLTFWQCVELSKNYDIKPGSLYKMLYSSYLVKKLENKVFCLFGTEIDNEKVLSAIELAKKEYKENSDLEIEIAWTKEKKVLLQFNLTKVIKLRGLLYLPNNVWDNILMGSYYNYEIKDYLKVGGNSVWGLGKFLEKYKLDSKINIEFSFDPTKTVKVYSN